MFNLELLRLNVYFLRGKEDMLFYVIIRNMCCFILYNIFFVLKILDRLSRSNKIYCIFIVLDERSGVNVF